LRAQDGFWPTSGRCPFAAAEPACELLEDFQAAGFGGLIKIGGPAEPILGCPVASGKIGIAFYAGVNGVVAACELGAKIETAPISMLVDYSRNVIAEMIARPFGNFSPDKIRFL